MHLVEGGNASVETRRKTDRKEPEPGFLSWAMEAIVQVAGGAWTGRPRPKPRRMKVLDTLAIGPRKQLLLVCCDGEKYLVGTGPESVQTIVRMEARTSGLSVVPEDFGELS